MKTNLTHNQTQATQIQALISKMNIQEQKLAALLTKFQAIPTNRYVMYRAKDLEQSGYIQRGKNEERIAKINIENVDQEFMMPIGSFFIKQKDLQTKQDKSQNHYNEIKQQIKEIKSLIYPLINYINTNTTKPQNLMQDCLSKQKIEYHRSKLTSLRLSSAVDDYQGISMANNFDDQFSIANTNSNHKQIQALQTIQQNNIYQKIPQCDLNSTKTPKVIQNPSQICNGFIKPTININNLQIEQASKRQFSPLSPIIKKQKKTKIIYIRK